MGEVRKNDEETIHKLFGKILPQILSSKVLQGYVIWWFKVVGCKVALCNISYIGDTTSKSNHLSLPKIS